jgi:hypothetical protein
MSSSSNSSRLNTFLESIDHPRSILGVSEVAELLDLENPDISENPRCAAALLLSGMSLLVENGLTSEEVYIAMEAVAARSAVMIDRFAQVERGELTEADLERNMQAALRQVEAEDAANDETEARAAVIAKRIEQLCGNFVAAKELVDTIQELINQLKTPQFDDDDDSIFAVGV